MNTTKQALIKLRELLSKEENWTTGFFAKDIENQDCFISDPKACKFCLLGGIMKVVRDNYPDLQLGDNVKLSFNMEDSLQKKMSTCVGCI